MSFVEGLVTVSLASVSVGLDKLTESFFYSPLAVGFVLFLVFFIGYTINISSQRRISDKEE